MSRELRASIRAFEAAKRPLRYTVYWGGKSEMIEAASEELAKKQAEVIASRADANIEMWSGSKLIGKYNNRSGNWQSYL
jgi:hypothetical protein